jgi:hypothetical protein
MKKAEEYLKMKRVIDEMSEFLLLKETDSSNSSSKTELTSDEEMRRVDIWII